MRCAVSSLPRARRHKPNQRSMSRPGSKSLSDRSSTAPGEYPSMFSAARLAYRTWLSQLTHKMPTGLLSMENCVRRRASALAAPSARSSRAFNNACSRTLCWRRCHTTMAMLANISAANNSTRFCQKPGEWVERANLGCNQSVCSCSISRAGIAWSPRSTMPANSGKSRRVPTRKSCGKPMSPTTAKAVNSGSAESRASCASSITA